MYRLVFPAAVLFLAAAGVCGAEPVEIASTHLAVRALAEQQCLEVQDVASGKTFIKQLRLAGGIQEVTARPVTDAVWGEGQELLVRGAGGRETSLRVFDACPFVQIHATVVNGAPEPYVTASLQVLEATVDLGLPVDRLRSFGTDFLNNLNKPVTSFSFTALVDPQSRAGVVAAQLTHEQSSGLFTTQVAESEPTIAARLDFGRFEVAASESRGTDTLLVGYFDDARLGLEAYAAAVVKQYAIQLRPETSVYCTWYHARASNEQQFARNAEFAAEQLKPFGLTVMQIDDGWQRLNSEPLPPGWDLQAPRGPGPVKEFVTSNANYPRGMAHTAERTVGLGLVAGLWFMPFAGDHHTAYFADRQDLFAHWPDGEPIEDKRWSGSLLDLTNPKTQQFVHDRTRRIYDWGYRYFKLDGMHTGAVTHNVYVNTGWRTSGLSNSRNFIGTKPRQARVDSDEPSTALHDPGRTHIEAYRIGLDLIRQAAPEAYILGCNVSQNMRSMGAAFDKIDAMRIGPDNNSGRQGQWPGVTVGPKHGSNLYFLNDRVWRNDPDPVYFGPGNPLESARLMASWVAVTGSMLTVSEQFAELPPERLDLLKRTLPGHDLKPRPADLFEHEIPRIWLLTDTRRPVRRDVIGLFNWNQRQDETITCPLDRIGLEAGTRYVGFDFWADRFVGPIKDVLQEQLPAGTCRVLAVRPAVDRPQLLSTSRHITQGIVDVLDERWDEAEQRLCGTSSVVAGDPYELRIGLPEGSSWKVSSAAAEPGVSATVGLQTDRGVRVTLLSPATQTITWTIAFDK